MPALKRLRLKLKVSDVRGDAGGVGMMYIGAHSSGHFEKPDHGICLFYIELKSHLMHIHARSPRLTVTSLLYERRKGVQYGDERAYVYRMPDGMYADCNHGKW